MRKEDFRVAEDGQVAVILSLSRNVSIDLLHAQANPPQALNDDHPGLVIDHREAADHIQLPGLNGDYFLLGERVGAESPLRPEQNQVRRERSGGGT
jgi:hypothetical protein